MKLFGVGSAFFGLMTFVKWFSCESFALYAFLMIICLFLTVATVEAETEDKKPVKRKGMSAVEAVKVVSQMKVKARK